MDRPRLAILLVVLVAFQASYRGFAVCLDGGGCHPGSESAHAADARPAGHEHSGHEHSGHEHSGHEHSGHEHSGHGHLGQEHSADELSALVSPGQRHECGCTDVLVGITAILAARDDRAPDDLNDLTPSDLTFSAAFVDVAASRSFRASLPRDGIRPFRCLVADRQRLLAVRISRLLL